MYNQTHPPQLLHIQVIKLYIWNNKWRISIIISSVPTSWSIKGLTIPWAVSLLLPWWLPHSDAVHWAWVDTNWHMLPGRSGASAVAGRGRSRSIRPWRAGHGRWREHSTRSCRARISPQRWTARSTAALCESPPGANQHIPYVISEDLLQDLRY